MTEWIRKNKSVLLRLAFVTAVIWAVWFPLVTSGNIRMDSDRMIHSPYLAMQQYVFEGRGGIMVLLQLFGLTGWHPLRSGVLFLLFFSVSCWMLYFSLRRQAGWKKGYWAELFLLLYGLSPIWAYHGYFVLQLAPVGFGMILATGTACADAMLLSRKAGGWFRFRWELVALLLLMAALMIYQTLIVCYLAVLLMLLFCRSASGEKIGFKALLPTMFRTLAALVLYVVSSGLLTNFHGHGTIAAQVFWGFDSVAHCLYRIALEVGATVLMYTSRYFSLFTLGFVLILVLWIRKRKTDWKGNREPVLIWLAMSALPFALTLLLGNVTVPRSQFALQLAAAFFPVCYMVLTPEKKHRVLCAVCALAVLVQAGLAIRLTHTDNVRNEHDTKAAAAISAELENISVSKPLVFIGVLKCEDQSILTEKSDVFGRSFFEWIWHEDDPSSATNPAARLLNAYDGRQYMQGIAYPEYISGALEVSKDMPSYPEAGFVREEAEYTVIKLSDP